MLPIGPVKMNCGFFYHHGIHDGNGFVIHNSKKHGKVVRETIAAFSEGKQVIQSDIKSGNPESSVEIAHKLIGIKYKLFSSNCEHFVQYCNQNSVISPQIQKYLIGATGLALFTSTKNKHLKITGLLLTLSALFTSTDKSPINSALTALTASAGLGMISN